MSAAAGAVGSPVAFVGVGIDAVDIERFRRVLERRATMSERLFSDEERDEASETDDPTPLLAACFAAKEAVMKALGSGLWTFPLRDVAVVGAASVATLRVTGRAAARAERLGVTGWHLSLSTRGPTAMAVVLAEGSTTPIGFPAR